MHPTVFNGHPANYAQYNTGSGLGDYRATRPTAGPLNCVPGEFPYNSSPGSQATAPSEPSLTPASDQPPPHTYPCQQPRLQESQPPTPSSSRLLTSPPSTVSYKLEEADTLLQLGSPHFSPSALQSGNYHTMGSGLDSPSNWPSSASHQLNPPQFSWDADDSLQSHNMAPGASTYQFPRQMPTAIFGGSAFDFSHQLEPESSTQHNEIHMASQLIKRSPTTSSSGRSPPTHRIGEEVRSKEEEDVAKLSSPASRKESGDRVKPSIPYAKLLRQALLDRPNATMKLQEIYQWFRENTDRASNESKGWQNSIRHNLSMNAAFIKCDCKAPGSHETKKSTEWMLAPWAILNGVESTTRYRKGNPVRRCGPTAHQVGRRSGVNNRGRAGGARRTMLSQSTNSDLLARHVDPLHVPIYHNRPLSYEYAQAPIGTHPASNANDWMSRPTHPVAPQPIGNYDFGGYTYSNPSQNQPMDGLPPNEHSQALYPTADVMGAYGGSHTAANPRVHGQHMTLSPPYNELFSNPQETEDRTDSFAWN
ncbi:hypothetical protein F5Y14DRAFT_455571 [Nemania sp. NC0429]|nr:hypothetical protein F5Y14DRAFT_455556 [Nemania sp. NC0429]KAI1109908.1 hypothetical protein F5Y14DRAFT_455571 [Nemania sp. NC0429]